MKGKLIVIDGTDGSGKATQTNLLVEKLRNQGHKVELVDFPRYGQKSAALVEDYLNGKFGTAEEVGPYRASIFYAVDRYAASSEIKKWLSEGKIVISNRYVSSNMGHQTGKIKDPNERDKFLKWLEDLEFVKFGIPQPDVTIFLYVPPEVGRKLVEKKGKRDYIEGEKVHDIHTEDIGHLKEASEAYKYVAKKYNWVVVDCTNEDNLKSIEEIHEVIWDKIKDII